MVRVDPKELKWLQDHPWFDERPATIVEFLGPKYLNIEDRVRQSIKDELGEIFGHEVDGERIARYARAMITGGIGIGKTTVAALVLPYMAHWVLCLRDPQGFFHLLPGSRIAFMQMSTSAKQAEEVVFGDIKARIDYSPWFEQYPYDRNFKKQIRLPKDIWILPGDSAETTFEGYNILGGILDEADSHKVTQTKDYAEIGFDTIHARIASRFEDRGFLLVIGQMKKGSGFAARKFQELKKDSKAYTVRMSIWESLGWDHFLKPDKSRDSFWYDSDRKEIVPPGAAVLLSGVTKPANLIEIPRVYQPDFQNNPEKALRDLAGIPPATGSPFISLTYKVKDASNRWRENHKGLETPVDERGKMAKWLHAEHSLKRVAHIDMAYSANGDALGLAMGHVPEMREVDGELKPYIVIDLLMRIHAPAGREIFLGDVRRIIYDLKDERKFRLVKVTMDGFQSTDTRQQLERRRIESEVVSVDKQMLPYYDLREAIYEDRIEFPRYMVRLRPDDSTLTEIAFKELSELIDDGDKVDHPPDGSKDVADAMAGVVFTLMGERTFHRKTKRVNLNAPKHEPMQAGFDNPLLHQPGIGNLDLHAPLPPVTWIPPKRG
jgi:hypothetical protein